MAHNYSMNQNFDSDDEEVVDQVKGTVEGTIFAIDCSVSMFEKDENENCMFKKCLSVFERLLLNKIITKKKDLFGVVLYNTEKSPEPDGPGKTDDNLPVSKNCAILIPMQRIEEDTIRYVKNMKNSPDFLDFDNKFGHSVDAKISDVLWMCSTMFSNCGKKISIPQVMWFTDKDSPHPSTSNEHIQAFQKAKDLQPFHMDFQFFPMKENFNGDLFYKELIAQLLDVDVEDYPFPEPEFDEKILLQRMFRQGYKKRAIGHINVELSEKAKFGVGIYTFVRKSVVPRPVKIARDTNEEIVAKRTYKYAQVNNNNDEGDDVKQEPSYKEKLEPAVTLKYQQCGGEKILFAPMEAFHIKQMMDPKIKILGFKPSSVIVDHYHIQSPYFIYPSDERILNSSVLFRALWERCLIQDKVVICTFNMRHRSSPKLVALVPQEADPESFSSDGFRMHFIPFAGDIRDFSEVMKVPDTIDAPVSDVIKSIIGRLRLKYDATMFTNPVVKRIYAQIEHQLFAEPGDEPDEEISNDPTMPDIAAQDSRIGEFVDKLESIVGGFESDAKQPAKRKGAEEAGEPKKPKINPDDINEEFLVAKCKANDIKILTVPMLRGFLQLKNVKGNAKMNKAQMVEYIKEHF